MTRPVDYYTTTPAGAAQVNRNTAVETWADEPQPAELDAPFKMPDREWCPGCERRDCIDCAIRVALGQWGAA